jgi:uncharacterized membrane protein/mono/diheme cytochrome c family protein
MNDWASFFGRFHPVLVHLPIGFLLLAGLLEVGRLTNKITVSDSVISFVLFWSAIGATLACGAGYLLSLGGGYEQNLLEEHKWQGIWVAVFAWVAWVVKSDWLGDKIPFSSLIYLPALGLGALFTMSAGHHGGSLTHGEDYLTQETPQPFRAWLGIPDKQVAVKFEPIKDVNQAQVYQQIVQPILQQSCVQCHNASKSKGDLRMDEVKLLQKGGENGPIFVAGKAMESEMIKRCLLPLEDEHHMPPKGKTQLTDAQVSLLSWWIDQGAPFDKKVVDLKVSDNIKPVLAALGGGAAVAGGVAASTTETVSPVLALKVPAPDAKAMDALKKTGLLVLPLSTDTPNILEVSAVNAADFNDTQAAQFNSLSQQIVWLKLSDTKITDRTMAEVAKLKNLQKIHLENTAVTDAGLKNLKGLPYLEYVNLVGTQVTDAGLKELAACKSLKQVYVWQTKATEAGVAALKQALPNVEIVLGTTEKQIADFIKSGETAPKPEEKAKK